MTKFKYIAGAVLAGTIISLSGAQAKDFYKMSTISLPTAFAIHTTFAKVVTRACITPLAAHFFQIGGNLLKRK